MNKLFSYGTLQDEKVQLQTFGRKLLGSKDILIGYKIKFIKITDPEVIKLSGKEYHPALISSNSDNVDGMVFEVTNQEIKQCDEYEKQYKRVVAKLKSGSETFVYIAKI